MGEVRCPQAFTNEELIRYADQAQFEEGWSALQKEVLKRLIALYDRQQNR